jgi:hypothetical protein
VLVNVVEQGQCNSPRGGDVIVANDDLFMQMMYVQDLRIRAIVWSIAVYCNLWI